MLQIKEFDIPNTCYEKKAICYTDSDCSPKAMILYFHGGGLLYGDKKDLPEEHILRMTTSHYGILAFDYPLAPALKLPEIIEDVCASIEYYVSHSKLPYFLWGRSAGAYLCLIAAANKTLSVPPSGILSYYGYGFLCDHWFESKDNAYKKLPQVSDTCLLSIPQSIHSVGDIKTHYSLYVYARQQGCWKDLIYEGRDKYFYMQYSLRLCDKLPCPLFCAHSTADPDVPYEEFLALCQKYNPKRYVTFCSVHDFDRDASSTATNALLTASIEFLDANLF